MTTPRRSALRLDLVTLGLTLTIAAAAVGYQAGYERGQRDPGCEEDEVLAVQHDPDPAHGLTWACENTEEFIERWSR